MPELHFEAAVKHVRAALACLKLCITAAAAAAAAADSLACGANCRAHSPVNFRACLLDIKPAGRAVFPEDGPVYEHARRWVQRCQQGAGSRASGGSLRVLRPPLHQPPLRPPTPPHPTLLQNLELARAGPPSSRLLCARCGGRGRGGALRLPLGRAREPGGRAAEPAGRRGGGRIPHSRCLQHDAGKRGGGQQLDRLWGCCTGRSVALVWMRGGR